MQTETNNFETTQRPRSTRLSTGNTRYVEYRGINCVTVRKIDGQPYFFLFADIDDKDDEKLRRILQFCKQKHLSIYWYDTVKGRHAISPVLLHLREWTRYREQISNFLNYSFDTLRWSRRFLDGEKLMFERYSSSFREESFPLHHALCARFNVSLPSNINYVDTLLTWSHYCQLRLIKK